MLDSFLNQLVIKVSSVRDTFENVEKNNLNIIKEMAHPDAHSLMREKLQKQIDNLYLDACTNYFEIIKSVPSEIVEDFFIHSINRLKDIRYKKDFS